MATRRPAKIPAPSIRDTFSKRLREVREERGLTLDQLSKRTAELGHPFPGSAINKIEHGRRDASIGDLVALAAALNISPVHLLLPTTPDEEAGMVRLGKDGGAEERVLLMRHWFCGTSPLKHEITDVASADAVRSAFYAMTPPRDQYERDVAHHPLMMKIGLLELFARDFARIATGLSTAEVIDEKVLWAGIVRELGDVITLLNMAARDAGLEPIKRLTFDHDPITGLVAEDKPKPTKRSKR